MNLLVFREGETTAPGEALITGARAAHLAEVKKLAVGGVVEVGEPGGKMGDAVAVEVGPGLVRLKFELTRPPPPPSDITLICALPRPKSFKKALHAAVTCGIKSIWFVGAWKVEKSYWLSPVIGGDSVRELCLEALEQASDTVMPEVCFRRLFKPFVEDELPALAAGKSAFLAEPGAMEPMPSDVEGPAALAVGPEGGFTEYEKAALRGAGFSPVGLGSRILRVEFAVAAASARLKRL